MSESAGADDGDKSAADTREPIGVIERFEGVTLFRLVAGVTVLALIARLVALDARAAHWDEARVAYWSHYYAETGSLGYYWEEHGPLAQIMGRWMFEIFGVTDTAVRLPIAVIGGLLPLSALLYREHLRDSEVVALSVFLATNSVLLYYSRFMRSDVLVAAFMFTAFGLLVRFVDTRRYRYLYGVGAFVALGFGSKENAIIYLLTWGGATALLVDQWLHSPASGQAGKVRFYRTWAGRRLRGLFDAVRSLRAGSTQIGDYRARIVGLLRGVGHVVGASVVMLGTAVFVFADRGDGVAARELNFGSGPSGLDLAGALSQPTALPGFAVETLTSAREDFGEWFSKSSETTLDTYIEFLDAFLGVLASNAPVLFVFAVFGFVLERYARDDARWLVLLFGYAGAASLVGYPLGTDVTGAWAWVATHVVVPLAVPAAVGLAWLYRSGIALWAERDTVGAGIVALILVVVTLQSGAIVVTDVYTQPQSADNELVQFAQPHDDVDPVVERLSTAASDSQEPDAIVYYGLKGADYDSNAALVQKERAVPHWDVRPTCTNWGNLQPMNWYFAVADATVTCDRDPANLTAAIEQDAPAVVITQPDDYTVPEETLAAAYDSESYYLRTIGKEVVVYTRRPQ
jgi:uncharacterized protein (TIGR03663 family)